MKKSLLALAVLGVFAGAAQAQTSVTLFGVMDAAFAHTSGGGNSTNGMTNSGINSSRLGVRGTEDLGGGLKAGFWLEGQLQNDTGTGNATGGGLNFQRRSTVSLLGGFGELRLGRDYAATFWNTTIFDPFGTNGVAQSRTPAMRGAPVRTNNTIGYLLPNLGGLYGQLQYGFGEQPKNLASGAPNPNNKDGNFVGLRVGYANGPLDVAFATSKTSLLAVGDIKANNFGASYDFGMIKPMLIWAQEKTGAGAAAGKTTGIQLGLTAPVGPGDVRFSYGNYKNAPNVGASSKGTQLGLGYVYNLSKRTAAYGQFARWKTSDGLAVAIANNGITGFARVPTAGDLSSSSNGTEIGIRHSF